MQNPAMAQGEIQQYGYGELSHDYDPNLYLMSVLDVHLIAASACGDMTSTVQHLLIFHPCHTRSN